MKKFTQLLVTAGALAFVLKVFESAMKETTEIKERVGMDIYFKPQGGHFVNKKSSKVKEVEFKDDEESDVLDYLEELDGEEQEEALDEMYSELNKGEELSERQDKIMKQFEKNKKVDTDLLSKKIKSVSVRTFRRDLTKLEELGLIKKIGKTRGSYYVRT